ncbi:MAG: beta-propeller domain-containing protein, partial [Desulfobacterales bacterium]
VSFVGNGSDSLIYMSQDNLYVTHSYGEDYVGIFSKFINEEASNLFNEEVRDKLERLASYELSNETKMMEMGIIIESYSTSLSEDEAMRFENELENSMDDFMKRHIREFQSTGLMKVSLKNLRLEATGKVPGHPLNQFSLDEYKGNLRIATNSEDEAT